MKDEDGLRLNVGMVIINARQEVLMGCRSDIKDAWQFPQGGIHKDEPVQDAMYRELYEEVGLRTQDVELIKKSDQWYSYRLPIDASTVEGERVKGQKQKWFLLRLKADESLIKLDNAPIAEFCEWRWVPYWYPVDHIVEFKHDVYHAVLTEFAKFI